MEPSVWGYNRATVFLVDINKASGLAVLGYLESETVRCGLRPENDYAVEDQQ
jgi:hypothetical protein